MSARLPSVLPLLARIAAAVLGGYGLSVSAAVLLAYAVPVARADAVLTGLLASFAFYAGAVVWAFAARTALLAWTGIATAMLVFAGLARLVGAPGAP